LFESVIFSSNIVGLTRRRMTGAMTRNKMTKNRMTRTR